jgi:hypothetical protein
VKSSSLLLCALVALPAALGAQDTIPSQLAQHELGRSRRCVPAIASFAQLQQELEPVYQRANRIQALNAAVTLEDSARVAPFDSADSVEVAVREWFVADQELARQYVGSRDESIQERRAEARDRLRERLQEALSPLGAEVEQRLTAGASVTSAVQECDEAIFVRSAVLEACQTEASESPLCQDARTTEPRGRFAFVENAPDLWDVEELRPWSEPAQLYRTPDGALAGARTATRTRRGNLMLALGLEPMLRARSTLSAEELAEMDANLDTLGFVFEDARYAMSPVLTLQLNVSEPIGEETHYVLHFGDLSDPLNDVIWSAPATPGTPVQAVFAPQGWVLNALAAGESVYFTAVKMVQEGIPSQAVFVLGVTPVGQARTVGALLGYMKSGQLGKDLMTLIPPTPPPDGAAPAAGAPPPAGTPAAPRSTPPPPDALR